MTLPLSITTRETIRFAIGHARHPGQPQRDAAACNSCDLEAKEVEMALVAHLLTSMPESPVAEATSRGLCRWHPWGCPTGRGYYEGPRLLAAGPPLTQPHDNDPATWQEL